MKKFTVANYIISGTYWLGGLLTLIFNALGLWVPWHLAAFATLMYLPIALISEIIALFRSFFMHDDYISWEEIVRYRIMNLISVGVTAVCALLFYFVTCKWFW